MIDTKTILDKLIKKQIINNKGYTSEVTEIDRDLFDAVYGNRDEDEVRDVEPSLLSVFVAERSSADGTPNQRSSSGGGQDVRRRSQHVNRLQITHV